MDWNKIKAEYVRTDISLRELARKYGVSPAQVGNHSRAEGWVKLREQYLDKVNTKAEANDIDKQAEMLMFISDGANQVMQKALEALQYIKPTDTKAYKDIISILKEGKDLVIENKDTPQRIEVLMEGLEEFRG